MDDPNQYDEYEYGMDSNDYPDEHDYVFQEQQIAEFAFRDLERVGAERDIRTDPIAKFQAEVKHVIRDLDASSDEPNLLRAIDRLTFIAHKNPFLYVLGYLHNSNVPVERHLETFADSYGAFTMNDVLRYAKHWRMWLIEN